MAILERMWEEAIVFYFIIGIGSLKSVPRAVRSPVVTFRWSVEYWWDTTKNKLMKSIKAHKQAI